MKKAIKKLQERKDRHRQLNILIRAVWATGGFIVLGAGIAMLVLPGPGLLVIALGLAMLALEFAWAERLLEQSLHKGTDLGQAARSRIRVLWPLVLVLAGAALLLLYLSWRLL